MPGTKKGKAKALSVACAECKRLKLKCSKTVPCDACVRRGCESICPDGQLKAGKGTRFILSNTQDLHDEIDRQRARIRELEETVAVLRRQQVIDATVVPGPSSSSTDATSRDVKLEEDEVPIDTFGSLTLKPDGSSEWYGRHGFSEYLIGPRHPPQDDKDEVLPLDLMFRSKMFPFKSSAQFDDAIRKQIREYLPTREEGWNIAQSYYEHVAWSSAPWSWDEMVANILDPVYDGTAKDEQLAMFFVFLALGVCMDLQKQPNDVAGKRYAHLARICLMLGEDLLCTKSLTVIRCLHGLAWFYQISLDPTGSSKAWMLTAMAVRMAQAVRWSPYVKRIMFKYTCPYLYLDRDSERWNNFPAEAERRRRLWWELATYEYIQSFSMARPRCIITSQCDCKMPQDPEDQGAPPGFNRKKYKWLAECILPIMDEAWSPKPPAYSTVIKHDRVLRDFPMPDFPVQADGSKPLPVGVAILGAIIQLFSTDALRELALLYLHRTYLVEALSRWPEDPVRSRFGLSVLAVHRSSLIILQGFGRIREKLTSLLPRVVGFWLHGLSAYICLCAIVIRSPGCSLARSSMVEIERARKNFDQTTLKLFLPKFGSIEHARHVVETLYEQATTAYKAFRSGQWPLAQQTSGPEQADNDVLLFAGASNIFTARGDGIDDTTPASATNSSGVTPIIQAESIHPTLFEYLQAIQRGNAEGENAPNGHDATNDLLHPTFSPATTSATSPMSRVHPPSNPTTAAMLPMQSQLLQPPTNDEPWNGYGGHLPLPQEGGSQLGSISDLDSIFRLQTPSLSTQFPQACDPGVSHSAFTTGTVPTNGLSGSYALDEVEMTESNPTAELDFARFMVENLPGLTFEGQGVGWDTFLAGWQP